MSHMYYILWFSFCSFRYADLLTLAVHRKCIELYVIQLLAVLNVYLFYPAWRISSLSVNYVAILPVLVEIMDVYRGCI